MFERDAESRDFTWLERELERNQPRDPVFDFDEIDLPRTRRRRRKADKLFALLAVATSAQLACGRADGGVVRATDAILVQLAEGAAPPKAIASGAPIIPLQHVNDEDAPLLRVPIEPGTDPVAAAAAAAEQPGVVYAEPIPMYRAARTPDDPRLRDQWGFARVEAPAAWSRTTGSSDVIVAVVDDGAALDHPDLRPNLWSNPDSAGSCGYDFVDERPDPRAAGSWHGSHVSGIIGAAGDNGLGVVGLSWRVSLMELRALGAGGGRADDLARAIDFASSHGARVVNASWAGGESRALSAAIARATQRGVLVVASAGNDAASSPSFPSTLDEVLSVGASTPDDLLAAFSNRGALLAAPGVGILSTTAPGQYERYDGTSMAAAHVSGIAALLWAAHPEATVQQVRRAMFESAAPVAGVEHGRVDAARALSALDAYASPSDGLSLSRSELTFAVREGRIPHAQAISIHADGRHRWTAATDAPWIVLSVDHGETPQRVFVRIEPAKLGSATEGTVLFTDEHGGSEALVIHVRHGGTEVSGDGCIFASGALHVVRGAGCALHAGSDAIWTLPSGAHVTGARLDAQFTQPGAYRILVSADEGEVDEIPVLIE